MSVHSPSGDPSSSSSKKPIFQTNYPGRCLMVFGLFFALGTFFAGMMAMDFYREWRANDQFVEHTCVIVNKHLTVGHFGAGSEPRFTIKYTVNGREFQATTYSANDSWGYKRQEAQAILDRFEIGREYPCWYDPKDPATVVLVRGYTSMEYLIAIIPLAVMIVFGTGMYVCWFQQRTERAEQAGSSLASSPDDTA